MYHDIPTISEEVIAMDEAIRQRCLDIGKYMIRHSATVRSAAAAFGISKSSVHQDMDQRLPLIDPTLARQVGALLRYNKAVRHLRGGAATRRRYRQSAQSPLQS